MALPGELPSTRGHSLSSQLAFRGNSGPAWPGPSCWGSPSNADAPASLGVGYCPFRACGRGRKEGGQVQGVPSAQLALVRVPSTCEGSRGRGTDRWPVVPQPLT